MKFECSRHPPRSEFFNFFKYSLGKSMVLRPGKPSKSFKKLKKLKKLPSSSQPASQPASQPLASQADSKPASQPAPKPATQPLTSAPKPARLPIGETASQHLASQPDSHPACQPTSLSASLLAPASSPSDLQLVSPSLQPTSISKPASHFIQLAASFKLAA